MRKILICTPLRGDLPATYLNTLFRVMMSRVPGISLAYAFIGGAAVQWARDEAVQMARDRNCTELIFWDKDLEPTAEDWVRLLSHEKHDLVCALYAKRDVLTYWHATFQDDKEPDINGICQVFQSAIGFSKIKMSVFDKILANTPERVYTINNAGDPPRKLHEYFPMERVGPNTAAGKLARIDKLLDGSRGVDILYDDIIGIIEDSNYTANAMQGEDYSFCRLATQAGVPILLDTQLMVAHNGDCRFPIRTEILEAALAEEWRKTAL